MSLALGAASQDELHDILVIRPSPRPGTVGIAWWNVMMRAAHANDVAALACAMMLHADVHTVVETVAVQAAGVPLFPTVCAVLIPSIKANKCNVHDVVESLIMGDAAFRGRCVYTAARNGNVAFIMSHAHGDSLGRAFVEARHRQDAPTAAAIIVTSVSSAAAAA